MALDRPLNLGDSILKTKKRPEETFAETLARVKNPTTMAAIGGDVSAGMSGSAASVTTGAAAVHDPQKSDTGCLTGKSTGVRTKKGTAVTTSKSTGRRVAAVRVECEGGEDDDGGSVSGGLKRKRVDGGTASAVSGAEDGAASESEAEKRPNRRGNRAGKIIKKKRTKKAKKLAEVNSEDDGAKGTAGAEAPPYFSRNRSSKGPSSYKANRIGDEAKPAAVETATQSTTKHDAAEDDVVAQEYGTRAGTVDNEPGEKQGGDLERDAEIQFLNAQLEAQYKLTSTVTKKNKELQRFFDIAQSAKKQGTKDQMGVELGKSRDKIKELTDKLEYELDRGNDFQEMLGNTKKGVKDMMVMAKAVGEKMMSVKKSQKESDGQDSEADGALMETLASAKKELSAMKRELTVKKKAMMEAVSEADDEK